MNEELQDRTRRLRSDPFQSPENQLPSIPNHRTLSCAQPVAAPSAAVRGRCGTGMPVPASGCAPASQSRGPLPASALQPEHPGHPAPRPVPVLTVQGFLKEKNRGLAAVSFPFQNLPGTVLAESDEGRAERRVPRPGPAAGAFPTGCRCGFLPSLHPSIPPA